MLVLIVCTRRRKHFVGRHCCEIFKKKKYSTERFHRRLISVESCGETSLLYRVLFLNKQTKLSVPRVSSDKPQ